ncbi:hypothetical protein [Haloplanus pelagicus]|jgi:chromosome segregation ATPase|uniref:hypothetical protein n=1 Tax=Haloplanus pelagicus TaxID=2949995 RepID=UPI002040FB8E|nr:hypothetical protein [Haloplanus sp. HW8-1]
MVPSGLPTGTVSSGRDGPSASRDATDADPDARTRIAELERENEALRAAVEKQRRENERIVERYERLLEQQRDAEESTDDDDAVSPPETTPGALRRIAGFLGL